MKKETEKMQTIDYEQPVLVNMTTLVSVRGADKTPDGEASAIIFGSPNPDSIVPDDEAGDGEY